MPWTTVYNISFELILLIFLLGTYLAVYSTNIFHLIFVTRSKEKHKQEGNSLYFFAFFLSHHLDDEESWTRLHKARNYYGCSPSFYNEGVEAYRLAQGHADQREGVIIEEDTTENK